MRLPLSWPLLILALVGAATALLGYRRKIGDWVVVGSVIVLGGVAFAVLFWGKSLTLHDLPIESFGAMLCVALAAGHELTSVTAQKEGLSRDEVNRTFVVAVISGLIGARLLYVMVNPAQHAHVADALALYRGGLALYGGLFGGLVGSWIYLRKKQLSLVTWADVVAPGLALGVMVGRIGCYLWGCDFGRPLADAAPRWLRVLGSFPRWNEGTLPDVSGSPAWLQHVATLGLPSDRARSLPVHPTQLYETFAGVALLGLVFYVRKRRSFEGEVFLAFAFGYGVLRFVIEIVRGDAERGSLGPYLPEHLYVALALAAFGIAFSYGPARSLHAERTRRIAQALSVLPAIVGFFALRSTTTPMQLSTAQWCALISCLGIAVAWSSLDRARTIGHAAHSST